MPVPKKVTEFDDYGLPAFKLGELYSYDLINYPFLGSPQNKGPRYMVYAVDGNGNPKWFRAMNKEGAIAQFMAAVKADPKVKEASINLSDSGLKAQWDEQISPIEKWKAENWVDLGPAVIFGGASGTTGVAEWFGNISNWWNNLLRNLPFQIR